MRRVLTAIVLAPIFAYVVLWAPQPLFLVVLAAVGLLCYFEYSGIVSRYGIPKPGPAGYAAGLVFLFAPQDPTIVASAITLAAMSLTISADSFGKAFPRAAALVFGVIYIFGAWRCALGLRNESVYWLFFALALNWAGDIAAFYVGRAIGRYKLAPHVSPGKSWEGAIASLMGSVLLAAAYFTWLLPAVPLGTALAIAAVGNLAGQVGDLCESALKRGAEMKDSSNLLPGHGGWLDRVDSSLFSLPVVYFLVLNFAR